MVPGIAVATAGVAGPRDRGLLLTFGSMAVFLFTVLRHGFGAAEPHRIAPGLRLRLPSDPSRSSP
jgi:hypothetical protein